jgi:hypothetical protein
MPLTNWPPTSPYPSWPPPEIGATVQQYSGLRALLNELIAMGFTRANPTSAENSAFFQGVRCDEGHLVTGQMVVSPDALRRYPFAICNNGGHRQLLVLWPPDYCTGGLSGLE